MGLDNAGKTTILYQFLMNEVVHTSPTIGSNVEEVVWKNIHFIMWDLGGQVRERESTRCHRRCTKVRDIFRILAGIAESSVEHLLLQHRGEETNWVPSRGRCTCVASLLQFVILVVDSTDRERLSISKEELHKMLGHEELSKAAILVFANKQVRLL